MDDSFKLKVKEMSYSDGKFVRKYDERELTLADVKELYHTICDDKVLSILVELNERDKRYLEWRWKYFLSMKDIAELEDLTVERVRMIYKRAVRRLKRSVIFAANNYKEHLLLLEQKKELENENRELRESVEMLMQRFKILTPEEKAKFGEIAALKTCINDIDGISVRAFNLMRELEINTLAELIQFSKEDLMIVPNIGVKTILEIDEMLAKFGLKLSKTSRYKKHNQFIQ